MNALPDPRSFEEQCKQKGVEVRRRLMGPIRRHISPLVAETPIMVPVLPEKPKSRPRLPLWRRADIKFDAHVTEWLARRMYPCKAHMKQRCEDFGITLQELRGGGRKYPLVHYRHLVMWELKMIVKPDISYPEIGRLMGGRDHTTVLHAVRKISKLIKAEMAE